MVWSKGMYTYTGYKIIRLSDRENRELKVEKRENARLVMLRMRRRHRLVHHQVHCKLLNNTLPFDLRATDGERALGSLVLNGR